MKNKNYFEEIQEDMFLKEHAHEYLENNKKNRILIDEFKKEIYESIIFGECGEDWAKKKKLEFIENELRETLRHREFLEKKKKRVGIFFLDQDEKDLVRLTKQYKNLYYRYASLCENKEADDDRFSEDVIARCRLVPIENFISSEFINAGGGKKKTLCPFHEEKTGSFFVYENNSYFCFGCKAQGNNAIDFIMKARGDNFYDAVKLLKDF